MKRASHTPKPVTGAVIIDIFEKETEKRKRNTLQPKLNRQRVLLSLKKSWPEFWATDVTKIKPKDCDRWAARHKSEFGVTDFRETLVVIREIFETAMRHNYRPDNPADLLETKRSKGSLVKQRRSQFDALTDAVKSRILDRVLADLTEGRSLGLRASGYTQSDHGVYGKYQKQDADPTQILKAIKIQTESIVAEYLEAKPPVSKKS